jgi:hypothetical protein
MTIGTLLSYVIDVPSNGRSAQNQETAIQHQCSDE